ncbi:Platelet-activating factor acetylhydrolase, isoform II [Duganella sacchari]|uniref:Platelet-activating factor acetylhydrolase, isoform II n=1 Tax=Duganella sacchari TaxID=551987 RepID=A0A1M7KUL8_9BURK|nr:Platelet-activating factor acetylhydrolase, isoform II [Duganella sacchari]
MSVIDFLLVGGTVLFSLASLVSRRSRAPRAIGMLSLLAAGCLLQVLLEGWYWQFTPVYLLILLGLLRAVLQDGPRWRMVAARTGQAGAVCALGMSWVFLPVPDLPAPSGPYAVGTEVFRWVDATRPEPATDAPQDRRNIIVQAWYPAPRGAVGEHAVYLDGLGHLPRFVSGVPSMVMTRYDRINTHGLLAAPLSDDRAKWPVVLFSPGYGASRSFYTSLLSDLASRGFVVLAIDHPFEAAVTTLADGYIATPVERFAANDPYRLAYMSEHLDIRTADMDAVLDQLARKERWGALSGRMDLDRIAAIGHSFGGATAVAVMARDSRVKAAANIDGTLYGTLAERHLGRPFLLVESDHGETGHSEMYQRGNQRLIANLRDQGFRYQIARANHYSFTDAPLMFSPPARWLLAQLVGGSRGPTETLHATNDIVAAFLQGPLTGRPADIERAARRYQNIQGGPVQGNAMTLTRR